MKQQLHGGLPEPIDGEMLRRENEELQKRNRELEAKVAELTAAVSHILYTVCNLNFVCFSNCAQLAKHEGEAGQVYSDISLSVMLID